MKLLPTRRGLAAVVTTFALLVGGVGLGATSASAVSTASPVLVEGFPANPMAMATVGSVVYVVGGDGVLYEMVEAQAVAVPGAPAIMDDAVEAGGVLYTISGNSGAKSLDMLVNGIFSSVTENVAAGPIVAFNGAAYAPVWYYGTLRVGKATSDTFSIQPMAPQGVKALGVSQGKLYAAHAYGISYSAVGDYFSEVPLAPTDIIGFATAGDTLYARSSNKIYSVLDSGVTAISDISATSMVAASDQLYVKEVNSTTVYILGDSGFTPLAVDASGPILLSNAGALYFRNGDAVYRIDGPVPPVTSEQSVSTVVAGGSRSASVAAAVLGNGVAYSHYDQTITGELMLTVDDSTGSAAGWAVSQSVSDFVWSSPGGTATSGAAIPAANFAITSVGGVTTVDGQLWAVDPAPLTGALNSPVTVLTAAADAGKGTYQVPLNVALTIPGTSNAGTYTATLTTTMSVAP